MCICRRQKCNPNFSSHCAVQRKCLLAQTSKLIGPSCSMFISRFWGTAQWTKIENSIQELLKRNMNGRFIKVHIFWDGHKFLQNLHRRFVLCSNGQIYSREYAKFCGHLGIFELLPYYNCNKITKTWSQIFHQWRIRKILWPSQNIWTLLLIKKKKQAICMVN